MNRMYTTCCAHCLTSCEYSVPAFRNPYATNESDFRYAKTHLKKLTDGLVAKIMKTQVFDAGKLH